MTIKPGSRGTLYSAEPTFTYMPALDGLRAVSIALVVLSHFGLGNVVPGGFGVTVFFVISGFLITRQTLFEIKQGGNFDVGRFFVRRMLRLLPAAAFYIVLSGVFYIIIGGHLALIELLTAFFYSANYYDIWFMYHSNIPFVFHPFSIQWSLAVEEHYYLVFPFVALAVARWPRLLAIILSLAILIVTLWRKELYLYCEATRDFDWCGTRVEYRIYKATDTRIDAIMFGALLATVLAVQPCAEALQRWFGGVVFTLCILVLGLTFVPIGPEFRDTHRYTLQGVAMFGLLYALLFWQPLDVCRRALSVRPMIWVGRLSYSLYLFHWLAIMIACYILRVDLPTLQTLPTTGGLAWLAIASLCTVVLACASFYLVESPVVRLRRRFGSRGATDVPLVAPKVPASPRLSPTEGA